MKVTLLASLLLMATSAFAGFSETIIGQENNANLKDFTQSNMQNLHRNTRELVLTFDDGPTPGVTNKILDVLKEKNIKATFFVIASKIPASRAIMDRMYEEGHTVANHTVNHNNLAKQSMFKWKKVASSDVIGAHEIISPYLTNETKYFFRAPEGAWSSKIATYLNEEYPEISKNYVGPVMWDIGGNVNYDKNNNIIEAADWACWSKKMSVDECLAGYMADTNRKKGGVVLFHDLRNSSVELVKRYIEESELLGYTFKNLNEIDL